MSRECATFLGTKLVPLPRDTRGKFRGSLCRSPSHHALCPARLWRASLPSGSSVVPPARGTGSRSKGRRRRRGVLTVLAPCRLNHRWAEAACLPWKPPGCQVAIPPGTAAAMPPALCGPVGTPWPTLEAWGYRGSPMRHHPSLASFHPAHPQLCK